MIIEDSEIELLKELFSNFINGYEIYQCMDLESEPSEMAKYILATNNTGDNMSILEKANKGHCDKKEIRYLTLLENALKEFPQANNTTINRFEGRISEEISQSILVYAIDCYKNDKDFVFRTFKNFSENPENIKNRQCLKYQVETSENSSAYRHWCCLGKRYYNTEMDVIFLPNANFRIKSIDEKKLLIEMIEK